MLPIFSLFLVKQNNHLLYKKNSQTNNQTSDSDQSYVIHLLVKVIQTRQVEQVMVRVLIIYQTSTIIQLFICYQLFSNYILFVSDFFYKILYLVSLVEVSNNTTFTLQKSLYRKVSLIKISVFFFFVSDCHIIIDILLNRSLNLKDRTRFTNMGQCRCFLDRWMNAFINFLYKIGRRSPIILKKLKIKSQEDLCIVCAQLPHSQCLQNPLKDGMIYATQVLMQMIKFR